MLHHVQFQCHMYLTKTNFGFDFICQNKAKKVPFGFREEFSSRKCICSYKTFESHGGFSCHKTYFSNSAKRYLQKVNNALLILFYRDFTMHSFYHFTDILRGGND